MGRGRRVVGMGGGGVETKDEHFATFDFLPEMSIIEAFFVMDST